MLHTMHIAAEQSGFNVDLASLASQAAIALDDLVLERAADLSAVKVLADSIKSDLGEQASMDLRTAVALQHALIAVPGGKRSRTVPELLSNAGEFVTRLLRVSENGHSKDVEELEKLRDLCVALSRSATVLAGPLYDRSKHQVKF